ncbi:MAG TPA: V-type ATP synthase subunit F [Syntrophorhabdaceae bacterium]|nr:V-type ATP synthase subunit F [Syntrophorhabdaceae bacterium]
MAKAYIVGEKNLILGFKGIGFEIVPVSDPEDLAEELFMLSRNSNVGLILVTESMASQSPEAIREFRSRSNVILTVIPMQEGGERTGYNEMRRAVERSMGIDLFKKEKENTEE